MFRFKTRKASALVTVPTTTRIRRLSIVRRLFIVAALAAAILTTSSVAIGTPTASAASSCWLNHYAPSLFTGSDPAGTEWICLYTQGYTSTGDIYITYGLYDYVNTAYAGYETLTYTRAWSGQWQMSYCVWNTRWGTLRKCVI